jgi:hypothetical protein
MSGFPVSTPIPTNLILEAWNDAAEGVETSPPVNLDTHPQTSDRADGRMT